MRFNFLQIEKLFDYIVNRKILNQKIEIQYYDEVENIIGKYDNDGNFIELINYNSEI